MQPRTREVDTVQSTTLKVSECGKLDSAAYSFGVLTWKTTVHLRDALPCVRQGRENQQHGGHGPSQLWCVDALRGSRG
ncbi:hypothetical protein MRX96_013584 [Rhipicephalus microplus]